MSRIKVLLFATLRDRAGGKRFLEVDIPPDTTVLGLKEQILREHPDMKEAVQHVLVAVNHAYAADEQVIPENAEVAMFPPVSGG